MKLVGKRKRPLFKFHHRRARMEFVEKHLEWTIEDWKKVVWSYETNINCLGSDGRKYLWKDVRGNLSDRVVEGTVKFDSGNLMLWHSMGWDEVAYETKIDGRMDGDLYMAILKDELK
jgi:hypothetical protein